MDGKEQSESSQLLEKKQVVDTRGEKNVSEGNANGHSRGLAKTIQEAKGLNEKESNASNDMKKDLPGSEKDIQVQGTSMVVEKKEENSQNCQQLSTQKRAKPISKQNNEGRCTIPRPFSLSSEKRMPKMMSSLEQYNPSLTRSLNFKSNSSVSSRIMHTSLRLERITELRQGTAISGSIQRVLHTQTSLKVERSIRLRNGSFGLVSTNKEHLGRQEHLNEKKGNGEGKEVESKRPHSSSNLKDMGIEKIGKSLPFKATPLPSFYHKRSATAKSDPTEHAEQEREIDKTGKDSAFKAAPLPSFYHRRSMSLRTDLPEKIEEKKVNTVQRSSTFKAAPLPSFYHKKFPPLKPESIKIPLTRSKSPNFGCASKATSKSANIKMGSKNNPAPRQISDSVKETSKSSLKGQQKAPNQKPKASRNNGPSCRDEIEKRVVSSIEKSEPVSTN